MLFSYLLYLSVKCPFLFEHLSHSFGLVCCEGTEASRWVWGSHAGESQQYESHWQATMVELSAISQLTTWSWSLIHRLLSLSNRTLFWCIWFKSCVSHASLFQHFELVLVRYWRVALSVAVLAVAVYSSHVPHCTVSWKVAHRQAKYYHDTKWYCSILTSLVNYMVSIYSCGGGRWLKSTR